jgi:hypothetical protein
MYSAADCNLNHYTGPMQYKSFQMLSVKNCTGLLEKVRNECAICVVKITVFNNVHIIKIH